MDVVQRQDMKSPGQLPTGNEHGTRAAQGRFEDVSAFLRLRDCWLSFEASM